MRDRLLEIYADGGWVRYNIENGLPLGAMTSSRESAPKDSVWVEEAELIADAMLDPGRFRVKDGALVRQGGA